MKTQFCKVHLGNCDLDRRTAQFKIQLADFHDAKRVAEALADSVFEQHVFAAGALVVDLGLTIIIPFGEPVERGVKTQGTAQCASAPIESRGLVVDGAEPAEQGEIHGALERIGLHADGAPDVHEACACVHPIQPVFSGKLQSGVLGELDLRQDGGLEADGCLIERNREENPRKVIG